MKTISISRSVIVGIFIFLGIVIFVLAVFTIGSQKKTFAKSVPIRVIFDDVAGLQEGNNVWLSGVKIGTVKKMSFRGNTQVEILMNIDKDAQPHISRDAKAKISSDGFIGNKIVLIYGGSDTAAKVSGGDYLVSEKSTGTDVLLATLQKNNLNLLEITGNLKTISKRITDGQGTIGQLINDPSIAKNLNATISHFKAASVKSEMAMGKINDYLSGFNKEGTLVNELMTDTMVFANLKKTLDQLKEASYNISDFAGNLKQAGKSLNKTDNPAGAILNDQQMATDLKTITRNLNTSSQKLDEDLKALQSNFLFKQYFKNQEKQKKKEASKKELPTQSP